MTLQFLWRISPLGYFCPSSFGNQVFENISLGQVVDRGGKRGSLVQPEYYYMVVLL
jgi:hypothetical protein